MKNLSCPTLLFLLLALSWPLLAQQNSVTNLVDQPKWEVGTDLLWLIDKNTLPKYALLVRRKIGEHGAIRLRGGYLKNSLQPHYPTDVNLNEYGLLRLGYEYQKKLSAKRGQVKSLVYGGADVFTRYQFDSFLITSPYVTNPADPTQLINIRVNETTHDKGGAAFIGAKYFFTPYFSLSAESSVQISSLSFLEIGSTINFYSQIDYTVGTYQFLPLNTITLSFHF